MTNAPENNRASLFTANDLNALRVRASVEIRDCEQSLDRAHEIIKLIQKEVGQRTIGYGVGFVLNAVLIFGENILTRVRKRSLRYYDHYTFNTSKLK